MKTLVLVPLAASGSVDTTRVSSTPSKSGTIAITSDDRFVAMVNPETDSASVFDTTAGVKTPEVMTGAEPSSLAVPPIASGFAPTDATGMPVGPVVQTSPNQLASVIVVGSKLYATTVSASPAPPVKFNVNVQPVLEVVDLSAQAQDLGPLGT